MPDHPLVPLYRRIERLEATPRAVFVVCVYVPLVVVAVAACLAVAFVESRRENHG